MERFHHHDRQQVVVTASPAVVLPGGTLTVSIAVTGESDDKVRGGHVRLERSETYQEYEVGTYVNYDATKWQTAVVAEADFDPGAGEKSVSFTVPEDALPTAANGVEWQVKAVIARHHGMDSKGSVPITVLAPLRPDASAATSPPLTHGSPWFDVVVDNRNFRPGEVVDGRVVVGPFAPADQYGYLEFGFNRVDGSDNDRQCWDGGFSYVPGFVKGGLAEPQEFPFSLTVPRTEPPTVYGRSLDPPRPVEVILSVRVNTLRKMSLADNSVAVELNVYNHPPLPDLEAEDLK